MNNFLMDVYLGLGTNMGNKRKNLLTAAALLAERAGDVLAISSFYETEPWGFRSKNTFLNAALFLQTEFSPVELLDLTQGIEKDLGRTEKSNGTYKDRTIDIDILLYGNAIIRKERLVIPHPLMQVRRFVMEPLAEIAPFVIHPVLGKSMKDMLENLNNDEHEQK